MGSTTDRPEDSPGAGARSVSGTTVDEGAQAVLDAVVLDQIAPHSPPPQLQPQQPDDQVGAPLAYPDPVHKSEGRSIDLEAGQGMVGAALATDSSQDKSQAEEDDHAHRVLQDQTNLLPPRQLVIGSFGLAMAMFCSVINQTIVATALPTLGRVFDSSEISSWVGTAYLLTSTATQPLYGRISDIFGRKSVLLTAIAIFFLGSLACGLAQSMVQLIIFRAIQGIGGGGMITMSQIIISDVVTLKDRGKYQGIFGAVLALAGALGPTLGGIFTDDVSWRWCFYINLPLTALAAVLVIFLLPLRHVRGSIRTKLLQIDYLGSFLTLAWATLILLSLSWAGTTYPWVSAAVLVPLILGVLLLLFFIYVETKAPLPIIPFRIFASRTVSSAMTSTLLSGGAFYAILYYLPTFYQVVQAQSAVRSGVLILPLVLVQTVTVLVSGIAVSRTGDYWWFLLIGYTLGTIAMGLFTTVNERTSTAHMIGYQILTAVGGGQTTQTALLAVQSCVTRADMAAATSVRIFARQLGGTIALAVCTVILNNVVKTKLLNQGFTDAEEDIIISDPTGLEELSLTSAQEGAIRAAYAKGLSGCFAFLVALLGISVIITLFFLERKRIQRKRKDEKEKKAEAKAWLESRKVKEKEQSQA